MAMTRMFVTVAVAVMVAACGSSGGGGGGGGSGGGNGSGGGGGNGPGGNNPGPGSGGSSSADAPKILSIHSNVSAMTPADTLVISAVVTDPQGINDLIGGDLISPDGDAAYGAFATDASEGAYSISLSWTAVNTIIPVTTAAGANELRTLRAEFYDVEGNTVWRDLGVTLGCGAATKAACGGTCEDMTSTRSCGACDHACSAGDTCLLDTAGAPEGCGRVYAIPQPAPCGAVCQQVNKTCLDGQALYDDHSQLDVGCTQAPPAMNGNHAFVGETCQCVD